MMWMVGSIVHLFSIGIAFSALWQPIITLHGVGKDLHTSKSERKNKNFRRFMQTDHNFGSLEVEVGCLLDIMRCIIIHSIDFDLDILFFVCFATPTLKSAILCDGSITNFDSRMSGFDIGACLEVIEHMEEGQASEFGNVALVLDRVHELFCKGVSLRLINFGENTTLLFSFLLDNNYL
ncbi:unnamed protein product [Malus baccata var. baccata]